MSKEKRKQVEECLRWQFLSDCDIAYPQKNAVITVDYGEELGRRDYYAVELKKRIEEILKEIKKYDYVEEIKK